jgi:hypothetical protein
VEKRVAIVAMTVLVFLILLHSTCLLPRGKQKEEEEENGMRGELMKTSQANYISRETLRFP